MENSFPENFMFGATTSSFQIEGNYFADGATASNWLTFCHNRLGYTAELLSKYGCDHYNRWREDVQWLNTLGLDSYRFSIAWPRIMPESYDSVNSKGLDFYDSVTDTLLEYGIKPVVTLFHWDLPQYLEDLGGWANPDSPKWYAEYVKPVADRLGDRIDVWLTMNEPWVFLHLGMIKGIHAPGYQDLQHAGAAYKNIMKAHSQGAGLIRSVNKHSEVGISCNITPFIPDSYSKEDLEATRRIHDYHNKLFLDPILKGEIPDIAGQAFGRYAPDWTRDEIDELQEPIDFIGVNYYTFYRIQHDPDAFLRAGSTNPRPPVTDMNWEIYPPGLYEALKWTYNRYGLSLYITENGCAFNDQPENGQIKDDYRSLFLHRHLNQCKLALQDSIPVKGFFIWSLMDNFEWTFGFNKRFGLLYVNYESKERILKESAKLYRDYINGNIKDPPNASLDIDSLKNVAVWLDDIDFRPV